MCLGRRGCSNSADHGNLHGVSSSLKLSSQAVADGDSSCTTSNVGQVGDASQVKRGMSSSSQLT